MPGWQGARVARCQGGKVQVCNGARPTRVVSWQGFRVARCRGNKVPGCHGARVPWCQVGKVPWCQDARPYFFMVGRNTQNNKYYNLKTKMNIKSMFLPKCTLKN